MKNTSRRTIIKKRVYPKEKENVKKKTKQGSRTKKQNIINNKKKNYSASYTYKNKQLTNIKLKV